MKYTVIKDTREQLGWNFEETSNCGGTIVKGLKTGDYTICGLEDILTIERKGTTGEFAQNIIQRRFEQELKRLDNFKHPFMILEFNVADIMQFPKNSGIPPKVWNKLRISPWFILKRLIDFQLNHKTRIILAGEYGREVAASIFKRMAEMYGGEESNAVEAQEVIEGTDQII